MFSFMTGRAETDFSEWISNIESFDPEMVNRRIDEQIQGCPTVDQEAYLTHLRDLVIAEWQAVGRRRPPGHQHIQGHLESLNKACTIRLMKLGETK